MLLVMFQCNMSRNLFISECFNRVKLKQKLYFFFWRKIRVNIGLLKNVNLVGLYSNIFSNIFI